MHAKVYGKDRRNNLIEGALQNAKELLERRVSRGKSETALRRMTKGDYKEKKPIFGRDKVSGKVSYYFIRPEIEVTAAEGLEGFWRETSAFLRKKKEDKVITEALRVNHTEKIRERIIKPWLNECEGPTDVSRFSQSEDRHYALFREVKEDPLFDDLRKSHLPNGINPFELRGGIDDLRKETYEQRGKVKSEIGEEIAEEKLEEEPISQAGFPPACIDYYTQFSSSMDPLEHWNLRFEDDRVSWGTTLIIKNAVSEEREGAFKTQFKGLAHNIFDKFSDEFEEINRKKSAEREKKKELKSQLTELLTYEILPGSCKFLRGK